MWWLSGWIGKVSSGPELTGVLQRHENGEKWVADFIKDPASKYDDPYVKGMIDYFNRGNAKSTYER